MDFMLAAAAAAITNICLLGSILMIYIQNLISVKSYFTIGLVLVASLFIIQNMAIVIFWSNLYFAGASIQNIVDAVAPYLFMINLAQTCGLSVLLWISRR